MCDRPTGDCACVGERRDVLDVPLGAATANGAAEFGVSLHDDDGASWSDFVVAELTPTEYQAYMEGI